MPPTSGGALGCEQAAIDFVRQKQPALTCLRERGKRSTPLPMNRPLLLSGFMATGKSTVGRAIAEQKGWRFVDLDALIEKEAGASIAALFATQGEAAFRAREGSVLERELNLACEQPSVISLGGGALLDRKTRIAALDRSIVVTLTASVETILSRVRAQDERGVSRPLLAGPDPRATVLELLSRRHLAYQEAHARVPTDGRSVEDIARSVLVAYAQDAVVVAAGEQSYQVIIGPGTIRPHLFALLGEPSGTLLVTDENVLPLHGERARSPLAERTGPRVEVVLTPGEEHKNLAALSRIYQAALEGGIDRKATFVGLGGGVVTDMTGFAAATWVRGVRWIGLPTTLLSMVDASVGGKTAVDFETAKNSVGAFWQPAGVICDVETLLTETQRAYVGALSEVIKTALIGDATLLSLLEEQAEAVLNRDLATMRAVVERCVRVKARVVALDEREAGVRATLNFGHTVGHALESSAGYTGLTHGEAVSLGMVAALRLGVRKGHTPQALVDRVLHLLQRLGLPHRLAKGDLQKSTALLAHDKKRAGHLVRFVYARDVGDVVTEDTPLAELERAAPELADS